MRYAESSPFFKHFPLVSSGFADSSRMLLLLSAGCLAAVGNPGIALAGPLWEWIYVVCGGWGNSVTVFSINQYVTGKSWHLSATTFMCIWAHIQLWRSPFFTCNKMWRPLWFSCLQGQKPLDACCDVCNLQSCLILSDSSQVVFASGCSGKSHEHYAPQARQAVFPRFSHFDYMLILDLELLVGNFPFAYQCLPACWCTHSVPRSTWVRDSGKT